MGASLLIAGAGYLGQALANEWLAAEANTRVHILRRGLEHPPGTQLVRADLQDPSSLKQLPACTHLVYCAAADSSSEEAYQAIYEKGLLHVLDAYEQRGERPTLIYISSTSVYAERAGGWVTEEGELVTSGPSRFMVAGEALLAERQWPAVILRCGGIYGPGRASFLERIQKGEELLGEGPPQYTNRIHRDDCVGMIRWLCQAPSQSSGVSIYNAVDSEAAERNEVIRWLAAQIGLDPKQLTTSGGVPRSQLRGNKRVSNEKIRKAGYQFRYPSYKEGYAHLIEDRAKQKK